METSLPYEDLSKVCRICLGKRLREKDLINIFYASLDGLKVTDVLRQLFDEEIVENDGLPSQICFECMKHTMKVNEFVNLFYSSKKACQNLLDLRKPKSKSQIIEIKLDDVIQSDVEENVWENSLELQESNSKTKIIEVKLDDVFQIGDVNSENVNSFDEEGIEMREQVIIVKKFCNFCGFDLLTDPGARNRGKSLRSFRRHTFEEHLIEMNEKNNYFKCLKCKIELKSLSETEEHFYSDEHQNKQCPKCDSVSDTIKDCFRHRRKCRVAKAYKKSYNKEDFKCIHCNNLEIHGFENMVDHFRRNHENQTICMICKKSVKVHMELHVHKHRPKRLKYICIRCLSCFETEAEFADHKENFDHSKRKCEICEMVVPWKLYFRHKNAHKGEQHVCELCGKTFGGVGNLRRHYNCVHLGKRFYCDQCPENFTTNVYLVRHIQRAHPEVQIDWKPGKMHVNKVNPNWKLKLESLKGIRGLHYTCDVCGKRIGRSNRRQIILHKRFHGFGHTVMCMASGCDSTFVDSATRLEHMMKDHKQFICDHCNKEFFNEDSYEVHRLLHIWQNADLETDYGEAVCRICNNSYSDLASLKLHVAKKHNLHLCPQENCGKIFGRKQLSQRHYENVHTKSEEGFLCEVCNDVFPSEEALSAHENRHSESRPHKCDACTFSFNTVAQLKIHYRTHTGERPYACQYCQKTFAYVYTKKLHERLHTGEKPHTCPYCDRRFTDSGYCKKHIRKHEQKGNAVKFNPASTSNLS